MYHDRPPGAAKSLVAKATGNTAEIPTIAFDLRPCKLASGSGRGAFAFAAALKVVDVMTNNSLWIATFNSIGLLPPDSMDENKRKLVEQKRREFEDQKRQQDAFARSEYPTGAQMCSACSAAAVVFLDGCMTCLACGDSKCG